MVVVLSAVLFKCSFIATLKYNYDGDRMLMTEMLVISVYIFCNFFFFKEMLTFLLLIYIKKRRIWKKRRI